MDQLSELFLQRSSTGEKRIHLSKITKTIKKREKGEKKKNLLKITQTQTNKLTVA